MSENAPSRKLFMCQMKCLSQTGQIFLLQIITLVTMKLSGKNALVANPHLYRIQVIITKCCNMAKS